MSAPIKTVVVHGSTGLQGGSVARALSEAGYIVRAAVRDLKAPKAQELAALPNVELVLVDLASVPKLIEIYTGADAVFSCTMPSMEEKQQGTNMADAAKAAGVKLFIWSALESIAQLTKGNLNINVPVFDSKAEVAEYLKEIELPHTNLFLGGFMENFVRFPNHSKYVKDEDTIELQYSGMRPDVMCRMIWVEKDLPEAVKIVLAHPDEFAGQDIAIADIKATCADMARVTEKVSGRQTRAVFDPTYNDHIPVFRLLKAFWNSPYRTQYKGFPFPHPLLEKHGFKAATFEDYVRERLLPHLGL
ncbi:NAD(P)-binding protein [Auricularia subglabra TFB-10046 SS5]|nr:NAD(P)-binding protein [Auricularia subglabra TFB-10046 SS5]